MSEVGTQKEELSTRLVERVQVSRENIKANPYIHILRCEGEGNKVLKQHKSHCQEKPLARIEVPVPQTDTGR